MIDWIRSQFYYDKKDKITLKQEIRTTQFELKNVSDIYLIINIKMACHTYYY
jgi:hypothetical protein